jgi:hypothetical protein
MSAIGAMQLEKARLQVEVAELETNHDAWVEAGMLGKLEWCNPGLRPCIRVNEAAGALGDGSNYRVIQGH